MYQDVIFVNGPIARAIDDGERIVDQYYEFNVQTVKARLIGRPYSSKNDELETGFLCFVYEGIDNSIHIQQIQFLLYFDPNDHNVPHTLYLYDQFASLAEARASALGWLVDWSLGL